MKSLNKQTIILIAIISAIVLVVAFLIIGKIGFRKQTVKTFDPKTYAAVVNDNGITRVNVDTKTKEMKYFMKWLLDHNATSTAVQKPAVEELIDEEITLQYGQSHNLIPKDEEINKKYQTAVKSVGTEAQYLEKIKSIQGIGKEAILYRIKIEMVGERIEKSVHKPFALWLKEQEKISKIQKYD